MRWGRKNGRRENNLRQAKVLRRESSAATLTASGSDGGAWRASHAWKWEAYNSKGPRVAGEGGRPEQQALQFGGRSGMEIRIVLLLLHTYLVAIKIAID